MADEQTDIISIIVAVYNIKEYLPRCVESIMAQTKQELEIILVDDGSSDGSEQLCDAYALKDPRIRVLHKKNGGLSDARNAGLKAAGGAYIGYVDGDDYIEPDMYRSMLAALKQEHAQIAACCYWQLGETARNRSTTGTITVLSRDEALNVYICGHDRYQIYHSVWSKLFTRQLVGDMQFAVGKSSEDIMYTTEAFCRMRRLVYLDTPYYNYVVGRKDSIMNQKAGERRFAYEIPNWREQAAFLHSQGLTELSEKSRYHFYRKMLFYYIDFREAGQKEYADRLSLMLKNEKKAIRAVYRNSWTAFGDRVRIRVMLFSPGCYYRMVKLYDRYLIPLRQKR